MNEEYKDDKIKISMLRVEEVFDETNGQDSKVLETIKALGRQTKVTDLCLLTGVLPFAQNFTPQCCYWTSTPDGKEDPMIVTVGENNPPDSGFRYSRSSGIRPVIRSPYIFDKISRFKSVEMSAPRSTSRGNDKSKTIYSVNFGEYPQYVPNKLTQRELDDNVKDHHLTGKVYTFDAVPEGSYKGFKPISYPEYEYEGRKYIHMKACPYENDVEIGNGSTFKTGEYVWVEVLPVKWLMDEESKTLIAKECLLSGIRFSDKSDAYTGDFENSEIYNYMNKYMVNDLTPKKAVPYSSVDDIEQFWFAVNDLSDGLASRKKNPYDLDMVEVSEEDIILGAIESDVAVFLHGRSSEGKSARVKAIDPDCQPIYLCNATPESLNGKSVYNQETDDMIDLPPTWYVKLKERCEAEPDKLHIVFFDEITNARPSIQGDVFNIVLDKEVNGIWKLPDNARVVAAGNEMKDSLAANQIAEPLFNRFAHVYIETTVDKWLKWASEKNIHPAIYAFMIYKNGEVLRTEYTGEKPNADPRKWEMASNMLKKTERPDMLRALVGEEITREFVEFCNYAVITLEDVLKGNYDEREISSLNTAERYSTVVGLSQVGIDNVAKVREFVELLGQELVAVFDNLWTHGDEARLEIYQELGFGAEGKSY